MFLEKEEGGGGDVVDLVSILYKFVRYLQDKTRVNFHFKKTITTTTTRRSNSVINTKGCRLLHNKLGRGGGDHGSRLVEIYNTLVRSFKTTVSFDGRVSVKAAGVMSTGLSSTLKSRKYLSRDNKN